MILPPTDLMVPGRVTLRTLTSMRWLVVAGQLVAVLVVYFGFGFDLMLWPALALIAASVAVNIHAALRPQRRTLSERSTAAYLAYDTLQLAGLLYLTGGIENPFAVLLLGPMTVAAGVLGRAHVTALALLGMFCLGVLTIWHLPLPWAGDPMPDFPPLYRTGVWAALWLAAGFIAIYNFSVADEARRISDALVETQMALGREQRISSLGALAAAAAHELGTPLATIAVVSKELRKELPSESPYIDDVDLLLSQSDRCREILAELARRPESAGGDPFESMAVPALLEAIAAPYRTQRIAYQIEAFGRMPVMKRAPELVHGLGNLIQNAMSFARGRVVVTAQTSEDGLKIRVRDDGPGFPPGLLSRLGEPYLSQRQDTDEHLGLGIFIAQTLLERTGAVLTFENDKAGGAAVTIYWRNDRMKPLTT
jgi:two-component system sensor histidine kinase RegB